MNDRISTVSDKEAEELLTSNRLSDISDAELQDSLEFLQDVDADVAESFSEEAENRADAALKVVQLKTLIEKAREAGLDDDPAVATLEKRAKMLATDAGLAPEPDASAQLAAKYDAREAALENMHEDDREAFLEHLEKIEEIGEKDGPLAEREVDRRFDEAEGLLERNGVSAREVFDVDVSGADPETAELSGALSANLGEDPDIDPIEIVEGLEGSSRMKKAQLQDALDDTEAELSETSHPFYKHKLREQRTSLEEAIENVED